jgi:hypothetical protein
VIIVQDVVTHFISPQTRVLAAQTTVLRAYSLDTTIVRTLTSVKGRLHHISMESSDERT